MIKNSVTERFINISLILLVLVLLAAGVSGTFLYSTKEDGGKRVALSEFLLLETELEEGGHLDMSGSDEGVVVYHGGRLPSTSGLKNRMYTLKTSFELPPSAGEMDWALYTGLFEYPFRVYLNGYEIYREGRYGEEYNSSLRVVSGVYLPPAFVKSYSVNELVLEIYPAYETWGLDMLYLDTRAEVARDVFIRNFLGVYLLQGAFVLSLGVGIYFLALFLRIRGETRRYLYFSFFCFFFCVVYFNVVTHFQSTNELLLESISKSSMILLSTSLLFFIREFTKTLTHVKPLWVFVFISGIVGFVIVFIQDDKESLLSVFSGFLYFLIIPQMLLASVMLIYYGLRMKGSYFVSILVSFSLIIAAMLHDAYYFSTMTLPYAWMMTYGFFAMVVGIFISITNEQASLYLTSVKQAKELVSLNTNLESIIEEKTGSLRKTIEMLNYEIAEREKISAQLRQQASTDLMTGIMNRNYGISYLENQMSLVSRRKSCLSVCFIDLNDLKFVNDTFGHKAGDECIISTAGIISSGLRKSDVFCRIGGDEFMIIFSDTNLGEAESIIQRVVEELDDFNLQKKKQFELSISYGFSEFYKPWEKESRTLIEEADRRMYIAKEEYKRRKI